MIHGNLVMEKSASFFFFFKRKSTWAGGGEQIEEREIECGAQFHNPEVIPEPEIKGQMLNQLCSDTRQNLCSNLYRLCFL